MFAGLVLIATLSGFTFGLIGFLFFGAGVMGILTWYSAGAALVTMLCILNMLRGRTIEVEPDNV